MIYHFNIVLLGKRHYIFKFKQKYIFICKNKFLALSKFNFGMTKINSTSSFLVALSLFLFVFSFGYAQKGQIKGIVSEDGTPIPFANVYLEGSTLGTATNEKGTFLLDNVPVGTHLLKVTVIGYLPYSVKVPLTANESKSLSLQIIASSHQLEEKVVTGTLKAVRRSESPVPVEVYSPTFLKKNPTPSIFEALQNINGVRPQINCNVCNTGDIHINGLEGPYTLVLIDGMPIVSGLGTVYGLSGIPNSLIDQIEIVKGPITFFPTDDTHQQDGAEFVFNGHVRATEHSEPITALEYEQYEGMAETELKQLAIETMEKFPIHDLFCKHRIGRVTVGETSLHIVIWSEHRQGGIDAMSWFIVELKKRVPIWKWAIMEKGKRVPVECIH